MLCCVLLITFDRSIVFFLAVVLVGLCVGGTCDVPRQTVGVEAFHYSLIDSPRSLDKIRADTAFH